MTAFHPREAPHHARHREATPPFVIARPKAVAIHDFMLAWIAAQRLQ